MNEDVGYKLLGFLNPSILNYKVPVNQPAVNKFSKVTFQPLIVQLIETSAPVLSHPQHYYAKLQLKIETEDGSVIMTLPFYRIVCSGVSVNVYL